MGGLAGTLMTFNTLIAGGGVINHLLTLGTEYQANNSHCQLKLPTLAPWRDERGNFVTCQPFSTHLLGKTSEGNPKHKRAFIPWQSYRDCPFRNDHACAILENCRQRQSTAPAVQQPQDLPCSYSSPRIYQLYLSCYQRT